MKFSFSGNNLPFILLLIPLISLFFSSLLGAPIIFDFIKFSFFYILVIIPTSLALFGLLLKFENLNIFERIVLGYPATVVYYCIIYYLSKVINFDLLIYLSILPSFIYLIISPKNIYRISICKKEFIFFSGSIILVIALLFILFTLTTSLPDINKDGVFYQDILWTIGNTWSIIRGGFPVNDIRFHDIPFSYHMVQNIFYAFSNKLTGIDPFFLHMRFGPILDIFMLSSMVLVGSKIFLQWSLKKSLIFFFTIFFTCSFPNWVFNGYVSHIYINPISLFFGLNSFILIYFIVLNYSLTNHLFIGYTSFVLMFALASKSSLIFTLIPSLFIFVIINMIRSKKISMREIYFSGLVIIILGSLFLTIYKSAGGNLSLKDYPNYNFVDLAFTFVLRLLKPFFTLHVFTFILIYILNKGFRLKMKKYIIFNIFILIHFVVSISWIILFNFPGGEVYFIWYSLISFVFLFTFSINYLFESNNSLANMKLPFLLLFIGFVFFVQLSFQSTFKNSIWRHAVFGDNIWDKRASISYHEFSAMNWIKSNLDSDAVLISDRRGFSHEVNGLFVKRFFGYSSFSGKQFYNEGDEFSGQYKTIVGDRWKIVDKLLSSNNVIESKEIWSKIPAEYIVISKRFNSIGRALSDCSIKVYENIDVIVLKKDF